MDTEYYMLKSWAFWADYLNGDITERERIEYEKELAEELEQDDEETSLPL